LSRHGADLAYHTIYCANLKFVPAMLLPTKILDKAEAKSVPIILAKQEFNRNTAKPIRYCPKSCAGCGMIPWKVIQGEGQLTTLFIKHWRTNTIISKMLCIALLWVQWNAGTSKPILQHPEIDIPYLEARWTKSFRQSLTMANFSMQVHCTYVRANERKGDIHLMDWITNSKEYSNRQRILILNCCRQHLHITMISEMLDESGRNFLAHVFNGKKT
jgi:hypothetical protein